MGFFKFRRKVESNPPGIMGVGTRLIRPDANALMNSSYWCCVTLLCQKYATLPLTVHDEGSARPISRNRLLPQLLERPNRWMSHYDWMYVMGFNFENHGVAISILERASNGKVIAMYPVSPTTMTAHWTDSGELRYRCSSNGEDYAREDLLIINNTPAGYDTVLSPMEYASDDLELANDSKKLQAEYFKGGSVIGRLIKVPMSQYDKQKEAIHEAFSSSSGFRNIVLPDSVNVEPIKVEGEDISKLITAQQWDVMEVSRRFHVPKTYLGDTSGGYGTQEQQAIQFVTECLQPRCKAWEIALTHDLCDDEQYFKFELQSLMRGDHAARQAWYTAMLTHGVMSVNEVRELEDMEPIGKEGDVHYFQSGFASLSDIQNGAFTKDGATAASSEDNESYAKAKSMAESSVTIFETGDIEAIERRLGIISEAIGVTDLSWLSSYSEGVKARLRNNWNPTAESYRAVNAIIVKKCQAEGLRYTVDGKDPKDGYFEEDGKKFRNPPCKSGDKRIVQIWR